VVWVVNAENGEVQPKPVQIAGFREDGVLISQGLQAGDQVVIAGLQTLVPGQVVRPTPVVRSE
jgi:multidrug efflux pump subunit AcrA (membrane-fusion protein)